MTTSIAELHQHGLTHHQTGPLKAAGYDTARGARRPAVAEVPAHCPYKPNDWVRRHGYPGDMPGPARWGWRGFVTGYIGGTILIGVTDDGLHWSEEWGSLSPDKPNPNRTPTFCICCPRPLVFKAPPPPLTLFDLELIGRG